MRRGRWASRYWAAAWLTWTAGPAACGGETAASGDGTDDGTETSEPDPDPTETSATETDETDDTGQQPPDLQPPGDLPAEFEPPSCEFETSIFEDEEPRRPTVGDFDGDGHLDLAARRGNGPNDPYALELWRGDGVGGYVLSDSLFLPEDVTPSLPLVAGDLDDDGTDDLVYYTYGVQDAFDGFVAFRIEGGMFTGPGTPTEVPSLWSVQSLRDVNGDGFADLALGGAHSTPIRLFLGVGDGSFAAPLELQHPACYPQDIDWVDLDGNGELDLLTVGGCNNGEGFRQILIHAQDQGVFTVSPDSPETLMRDPGFVRARAFDSDAGLDAIAQGILDPDDIALHRGDGQGLLGPAEYLATAPPAQFIASADLDEDGLEDLFADSNYGALWLRNVDAEFEPCIIGPGRVHVVEEFVTGERKQVWAYDGQVPYRAWMP